jgi:hypothetical protein
MLNGHDWWFPTQGFIAFSLERDYGIARLRKPEEENSTSTVVQTDRRKLSFSSGSCCLSSFAGGTNMQSSRWIKLELFGKIESTVTKQQDKIHNNPAM